MRHCSTAGVHKQLKSRNYDTNWAADAEANPHRIAQRSRRTTPPSPFSHSVAGILSHVCPANNVTRDRSFMHGCFYVDFCASENGERRV
jgi:hypothetical protein